MSGFDAGSLEQDYAFLDECPERFLEALVTGPGDSLQVRVRSLLVWRSALLQGELPTEFGWPEAHIAEPALRAVQELGLARFCKGQPDLTDDVLEDLLASFSRRSAAFSADVASRLRGLEELERQRLEQADTRKAPSVRVTRLSPKLLKRLRAAAFEDVRRVPASSDRMVLESWGERVRVWSAISEVFGDLGEMLGRGWDLSIGVLKHTGWKDLLRLRDLVSRLPQLQEIVQSLGRLHMSHADEPSVTERVLTPITRLEQERVEVPTLLVPAETRGVERSGNIARMLPVEAALLGHPKLRLLWHARRSERALLTYRVEGLEVEYDTVERSVMEEQERRTPRPERGPILAVLDTSGSMHGTPELVAKALVLEALRTAHAEKRRCYLYTYSGPEQVHEQELDLTPEGIGQLLAFLGLSFGGGNDEAGVMTRVVERLRQEAWAKADVVLVSDGEWPAPQHLVSMVASAKEAGVRFHGVQVGNRGRTGLHAICDPVHVFRDWATLGGWS